jgi:hypothetical protein
MKLDRNLNADEKGKYALIKLRLIDNYDDCVETTGFGKVVEYHFPVDAVDFGDTPRPNSS